MQFIKATFVIEGPLPMANTTFLIMIQYVAKAMWVTQYNGIHREKLHVEDRFYIVELGHNASHP